ncbi:hypothetical protein AVMA1855_16335 [Acidovorax sp. SUPP1855]|uniref:hypothetical protein n=1 Tax=Acidovorax sp. SUPP1855 TaxID=431774 RepID=UPI0023DE4D48|nr:hypothetical protein [Acidovorax sp. SUPP1855]GKS85741.1 hypothetical protein AVMA1855_16335 [Acidovorax sp. SUPP1855]
MVGSFEVVASQAKCPLLFRCKEPITLASPSRTPRGCRTTRNRGKLLDPGHFWQGADRNLRHGAGMARSKRQPGRNEKPAEAGFEKNAIVGAGSSIDMSSCAEATAKKEKAPSEKSLGAFVPGGNGGTMNSQPKTQQNQGLSSV